MKPLPSPFERINMPAAGPARTAAFEARNAAIPPAALPRVPCHAGAALRFCLAASATGLAGGAALAAAGEGIINLRAAFRAPVARFRTFEPGFGGFRFALLDLPFELDIAALVRVLAATLFQRSKPLDPAGVTAAACPGAAAPERYQTARTAGAEAAARVGGAFPDAGAALGFRLTAAAVEGRRSAAAIPAGETDVNFLAGLRLGLRCMGNNHYRKKRTQRA
jgi:hypothetical protein